MPVINQSENLLKNAVILAKGAKILDIKALFTEQIPEKLGPTVPELAELMTEKALTKECFSSCGSEQFAKEIEPYEHIIVCGLETHVCIYQTVCDLLDLNKKVYLVADAIGSRTIENKRIGIKRLMQEGAKIASTEMILLELQKKGGDTVFKQILQLIK
ncbi:MAG: isochorismatase family protein [Lentisphaeria bacterium]|nr:isochorismatase family protein [Lentisphaeria bacterium]NQZ66960.1 isochorismatase family protein [Lentisphaeria bacterium]